MFFKKHVLTLFLVGMFFMCSAQSNSNKFRVFVGVGNNNTVSDVVTLADKSFIGELSGQARCGIRFYENYEIDFGVYFRNYPQIGKYPNLSYNKFLGYSGAIMYEFRKPDSRWGVPFGFELVKYSRNLDSSFNDGTGDKYYDHFSSVSFGPKLGARYHFSKHFFMETEVELLYEHYKWDVDWVEKSSTKQNSFGSFKFFGISANLSF